MSHLPTARYVPPFCSSHIWRQLRSSNEQIQANRKYKFNYCETYPRYWSKKYIDDLGKYLQLRLRRINRAARTTIYLASWKTFMARERYGVVSWQEVKKYFFGSTDSDALSWKRNFPLSFHDAFISHIKIFLQGEVLLLITCRWGVIWNYCEMFIFVSFNTVRTEKINILGVARLKITCKWKREMVSFVLGKEREKDVFRLVTSVVQRKNGKFAILLYWFRCRWSVKIVNKVVTETSFPCIPTSLKKWERKGGFSYWRGALVWHYGPGGGR